MDFTEMDLDELRVLRMRINKRIKVLKARARVLPAKFANPNDASETWAGRGLRPRWAQRMSKARLEECRV